MPITVLGDEEAFNNALKSNQVVIVDFHASWCGPCKQLAPRVKALSDEYNQAAFYSLDIDAVESVSDREAVHSLPTVKVFVQGQVSGVSVGSNVDKIRSILVQGLETAGLPTEPQAAGQVAQNAAPNAAASDAAPAAAAPAAAAAAVTAAAPAAATGPAPEVKSITSLAEFETEVQAQYVFVDFYASWCGPCKQVAPAVKKLAEKYPRIKFLKVDCDEVDELSDLYEVASLPTFKLFQTGKVVKSYTGSAPKALEDAIITTFPDAI